MFSRIEGCGPKAARTRTTSSPRPISQKTSPVQSQIEQHPHKSLISPVPLAFASVKAALFFAFSLANPPAGVAPKQRNPRPRIVAPGAYHGWPRTCANQFPSGLATGPSFRELAGRPDPDGHPGLELSWALPGRSDTTKSGLYGEVLSEVIINNNNILMNKQTKKYTPAPGPIGSRRARPFFCFARGGSLASRARSDPPRADDPPPLPIGRPPGPPLFLGLNWA